jgi:hypothetical protein
VLPRWQGGVATAAVTAIAVTLVILDIVDRDVRRFWQTHAVTTDTVAGLLVLGLTVLVVNQVLSRRQFGDRSRVVAAQVGFVLAQARRCVQAVRALQSGEGDRDAAVDETRSYSLMLMVAAPVLIDSPVARAFLDQAQRLAGEVARILSLSLSRHRLALAPATLPAVSTKRSRTSGRPQRPCWGSSHRASAPWCKAGRPEFSGIPERGDDPGG